MREGDTLVVPKLDRLARSVPDSRAIADQLRERGVKLALGRTLSSRSSSPAESRFSYVLTTLWLRSCTWLWHWCRQCAQRAAVTSPLAAIEFVETRDWQAMYETSWDH